MKVKLALLEKDKNYLDRIISVFSTRYADRFEIYSFTDVAVAESMLDTAKIDVLLAGDVFEIDTSGLPARCGFAYLVDNADIEIVRGQKAVCKFQKAELIYKQILNIYSEKTGNLFNLRPGEGNNTKIVLFDSVSGGAGASSMAAACALHYAAQNSRVLYLNLERYGSSDVFFSGEGKFDISDVIYALKSRKTNLFLKLESCVKRDPRGVFFYSQPQIALDIQELSPEEMIRLISELKKSGSYDYIVIDTDFGMDKRYLPVYYQIPVILWISDGSDLSNGKICRAYTALVALEQNADRPLYDRIVLVYNQFSNKTGKTIGEIGLKSIGGTPRYEHASTDQVLTQLAMTNIFDKIDQSQREEIL